MNKLEFIGALSKVRPSATFLTVTGYRNNYSEVADFSVLFHWSYQNALLKSLSILESFDPVSNAGKTAKSDLVNSFNNSLSKFDSKEEVLSATYLPFKNDMGEIIKGVKLHVPTDTIHLSGMVVHKLIRIPGQYPAKSKKTIRI